MTRQLTSAAREAALELSSRAARAVVMLEPGDGAALARLAEIVTELAAAVGDEKPRAELEAALALVLAPGENESARRASLERLGEALESLERLLVAEAQPALAAELVVAAPALTAPSPAASKLSLRDAETVELFGGFLAEGEEGLDHVDEYLLSAEHSGITREQVNAVFRVFHTIKGVAGFLDVSDVSYLAHATETLLHRARSGDLELAGDALDLVFQASTAMRRLLGEVRRAVEADRVVGSDLSSREVADRIASFTAGPAAALEPAPSAAVSPTSAEPASAEPMSAEPARSAPSAPSLRPASSLEPVEQAPSARRSSNAGPHSVAPRKSRRPSRHASRAPHSLHPAAEVADGAQPSGGAGRLRETVKVDLERIDSVVEMIGELIIVESMVVNAPEIAAISAIRVRNYLGQLSKISRDLQNVAMRMRMLPVRGVFQKMARLTRDLARKHGKNVQLVQSGETTEMDRSMVERIEDPLIHMIRNALDHAIETPDERRAAGKPELATVRLSAQHEGGSLVIEIIDDGRGLSREAILRKARQQGLLRDDAEPLSDADVHKLIFLPGFSTAAKVTEISGRGVGMDVVKRNVEEMRGRIVLSSVPGQGTTIKLVLPLTLAIIDGMLVACGDERYIVPSLSIVESLKAEAWMVRTLPNRGELINVRGEILPLLRLRTLLELPGAPPSAELSHVVVVESAGRKLGLMVDEVLTQQQVVIKPLGSGLTEPEYLSGAAILSDGRVGLILNVDKFTCLLDALSSASPAAKETAA